MILTSGYYDGGGRGTSFFEQTRDKGQADEGRADKERGRAKKKIENLGNLDILEELENLGNLEKSRKV